MTIRTPFRYGSPTNRRQQYSIASNNNVPAGGTPSHLLQRSSIRAGCRQHLNRHPIQLKSIQFTSLIVTRQQPKTKHKLIPSTLDTHTRTCRPLLRTPSHEPGTQKAGEKEKNMQKKSRNLGLGRRIHNTPAQTTKMHVHIIPPRRLFSFSFDGQQTYSS